MEPLVPSSSPLQPSPEAVFAFRPVLPPTPNPERDELERLGERIAELSSQIAAATYQLLAMIREFDERCGWGAQDCRSCAHWLNWRTGLAMGAAREKVRVARALGELPAISESMSRGEVSYSKVRAMTRVATPENEAELLGLARCGTAAHVERVVRAWRRVDRAEAAERDDLRRASRYLYLSTDEDGMVVVRGRLEPEVGAVLMRALEAAADRLYEEERKGVGRGPSTSMRRPGHPGPGGGHAPVPVGQQRADAIGVLAEAALGGGLEATESGGTRADRYQVVVHVDGPVLADGGAPGVSALEGGDVSAETSRRLSCDASRVTMTHDPDGRTLDVGRKTRAVSPALRRALEHRDRGCRFPGCGLRYCDAHHIHHWATGGETKLDNLVLLCRRHHRLVHEGGYRVEGPADGELSFYRPDGKKIPEAPPLPEVSGDAIQVLVERLVDAGVELDPLAGLPDWDGYALDLQQALDGLMWIGKDSTAAD